MNEDKTAGINIDEMIEGITQDLNKMNSLLAQKYTIRYYVLIYRLLKRGYATLKEISDCTGVEERAIYRFIDRVEELIQERKLTGV